MWEASRGQVVTGKLWKVNSHIWWLSRTTKRQEMGSNLQAQIFLKICSYFWNEILSHHTLTPMESGDFTGLWDVHQFTQIPVPSTCKSSLEDVIVTSPLNSWRSNLELAYMSLFCITYPNKTLFGDVLLLFLLLLGYPYLQGHLTNQWQGWDWNPSSLASEATLLAPDTGLLH